MVSFIVLDNKKEVARFVSEIILKQVTKKQSSILGLATGKTMIPIYKKLTKINFSKTKTFNLDEYLNSNKLRSFMNKYLFNKINIKKENIFFLDGKTNNPAKECEQYEKQIKKNKIDLQILGIGRNTHIGFNEPGSKFNSKTRKVKLTEQTRKDNPNSEPYALTMGIKTILQAKKIILIATGKHKARAVKQTIESKPSIEIPATALQKHKNTIFILDKAAASKI